MSHAIVVVPYNPAWADIYRVEAEEIQRALGHNCVEIHHIGSTSVPGLAAKPIIDILPVVRDIAAVDAARSAMEALGYQAMGEHGIPMRRFFQKGNENRTHNVHIYEQGNPEIARHLKFRDWLCTHPEDRDAYAHLKEELAKRYPADIFAYTLGKEAFVAMIDDQTGCRGIRIVKALLPREWDALKRFRQTYFFDKVAIQDPYTWTFAHPDHVHLILYQGSDIIGYTHLQLWAGHRVAMRIIVIDEHFRGQGLGEQFLALVEKWLTSINYKSIHTESSPDALTFYKKCGYVEMAFDDPNGYESDPQDTAMGKML